MSGPVRAWTGHVTHCDRGGPSPAGRARPEASPGPSPWALMGDSGPSLSPPQMHMISHKTGH